MTSRHLLSLPAKTQEVTRSHRLRGLRKPSIYFLVLIFILCNSNTTSTTIGEL